MAPSTTAANAVLRQVVQYHLDHSSHESALFFAETLAAQDPRSSEAAHLCAVCHLRVGDLRSAYDVGKPHGLRGTHLGCSWVFAQACLGLERYKDGITALEKARALWPQTVSVGKSMPVHRTGQPDTPAILCLLGKLYRGYEDRKRAVSCFEEALKANPFMWDAFKALCDLGVNVRVPNIFRVNDSVLQAFDSDVLGASGDLKENTTINTLDAMSRKPPPRKAIVEASIDPFNASNPTDSQTPTVEILTGAPENDFMSKIQAARNRFAVPAAAQPTLEEDDARGAMAVDSMVARIQHEPPLAPARKARAVPVPDSNMDAPPRMNYRLGTRRQRVEDRGQDQMMETIPDASSTSAGLTRPSIPAADRKRTVSGHPVPRSINSDELITRRSTRLNMFKPSTKANSGLVTAGPPAGRELKKARPQISRIIRPGSSGSSVGRVVSGNRKPLEDHVAEDQGGLPRVKEHTAAVLPNRSAEVDGVRLEEALRWTFDLMRKYGQGYHMLSRLQCPEAVQAFASLPSAQQNSPWVLAHLGRAYYEQASYADAKNCFIKMRIQAPSRLEDLEVFSTVLWHLKRETDLSFLAHELIDWAWHSPQAWCAVGNAWSLARDPEQALRCFKRATQLDPKFAYAFTLQGHEHVANEEYEKALTAYRQAISVDKRHYNAYYGIGKVQERLGAYDKAYTHFHAAQTLNPNNAVLICCIGSVLEKQKQIMPALQAYTKAAELAPRAAQTRYKKARALLAVGQIEAAQKELMILKDLAPDEGTVHFLLGTLYRSMNDKQSAVRHFTIALALDPKVS